VNLGSNRRRTLLALVPLAVVAAAVGVVAVGGAEATSTGSSGRVPHLSKPQAIPDQYIVVLKNRTASAAAVTTATRSLSSLVGAKVTHTYTSALRGFAAHMTATQAKRIAADPAVAYVEQDHVAKASDTETPTPSWGLDRIDQPYRPLNNSYTYPTTASNVHAYVLDTGILLTHTDFGGRATWGGNFVDQTPPGDCDGHGTHVAGIIGGTQYGVAKAVQLVAVKVLDCTGMGTESQILAGIDWVKQDFDANLKPNSEPAVANMSLGFFGLNSAVDEAVGASIADGITYTVSAGNDALDACAWESPADLPAAITVGATDKTDNRPWWSNFGRCVDVFAPGVDITSDWNNGGTNTISGTSMASPHVAGAAALILAANPTYTPSQVRDAIVNDAVTGAVDNPGIASPEKLLQINPPPPAPAQAPTVIRLRARANYRIVTATASGTNPLIANRVLAATWEEFDLVDAGNGDVALRAHSNGKYVTAESAGTLPLINNRTAIGLWEKFKIQINTDGSISLIARANGKYVTAESAGTKPLIANRTVVGQWEKFDAVVPPSLVSFFAWANGKVVTAESAGTKPLIANRDLIGVWETFDAVDLGNGFIALRAHANGKFVTAENAGASWLIANRSAVGAWEQFKVKYNADTTVSFLARANGKYVTAEKAGTLPLIANRTAIGEWESFDIIAD
jgi:subtilisin family serine protease